ncbi:DUF2637 domain-containing protein [Streptomyces sp. NPDC003027]
MRAALRRLRHTDPILIQAVIAAALSFAHIHDVAEAAGQGGWKAWAYPISVDVLLAVAWRMMRTRGGAAAWFWFLVAMAASLGANIATAGVMDLSNPPTWVRVVVAGWPVIAFIGGTLLVHRRRDETPELPPTEPQEATQEPAQEAPELAPVVPTEAPYTPVLATYDDVASALDVAPATVRGWANDGKVKKYPGPTPSTVRVDLKECKAVQSRRQPVGV